MECVSRVLESSGEWATEISDFWATVRAMFELRKSPSCGAHIHIAPWKRSYTLKEVKTIAFACCYYERYIVSCLPTERRDQDYCRRNTKVATRMGSLYQAKTTNGLAEIASDINALNSFNQLVDYMHGEGADWNRRRVLWNFLNLLKQTCTIEFRGGRQMLGPRRTLAWIAFAQVFILMALHEVRC